MPSNSTDLVPGRIVHVRQRQYLIEEVVAPSSPADSQLVRLACLDDDAQGQQIEVLWEKESDARILSTSGWEHLARKGFDEPKFFSAYIHTLRWNSVTATNPKLFQAPFRAGIRIDAYQLEPLRKALLLPRVNLFIADDVGLGKTIEAGLIARELLMRKKVRDIVVACPPSVLDQWQGELEARFGLVFQVLDRDYVTQIRRERGFGTNPWTTHSQFLISQRLLIDEAYAGPLRDWLGDFRPGSLFILDEAHHAAPASGSRYAIDSKITRAIRDVAHRFEHRLFLSATPHNGHSNSFSALLEILDPQRFCRGVPVKSRKLLDDVMVRRIKEDIRSVEGGFPERKVEAVTIDGLPQDAPELKLAELLDRYRQARDERMKGEASKRKQAAAALLVTGLQQRLLSSIEAFARTLRVHRRTIEKQAAQAAKAVPEANLLDLLVEPPGSDDDRASLPAEELAAEEDAQVEAATLAGSGTVTGNEHQLLDEMTRIAEQARGLPDARVRWLIDWIRGNLCPKGKWNETRILIFTEYEDTLRYLRQQLEAAFPDSDSCIDVYHGPTPPQRRIEIKQAFNAAPKKHPLRILLATDAAREGINLQSHCSNLFHFDLPWNPSRLEQRNGRIDRKLQPEAVVHCRYFIYAQRPEDRVLKALVRKTETIKIELGSLSQVIDANLAKKLTERGIRRAEVESLEKQIENEDLETEQKQTVQEELEEARQRAQELRDNVDVLEDLLETSREWLGLSEDHFRATISCGLELVGAAPLKPVGTGSVRFQFPDLDKRVGADPSWSETLDTLRTPRKKDQKFWEWRKDSPIRPVVFDDPGTMTDEVVHLHLEHRTVQRLLGRFIAQGFIHDDLSRACLVQAKDSIRRVVIIGRLCLYGPGAARLHEELIHVTARWFDPKDRPKKPLVPFAADAETKTLDLLEQSMLKPGHPISEVVQKNLQTAGPRDVEELLPHLNERGEALAEEARAKLAKRGSDEADAMRKILEGQRQRILDTQKKTSGIVATLFKDEEWKQLEADRRHWTGRLQAIERELNEEPKRIREIYAVKAQRIEPVGLVYLWPVTG